MPMLATYLDEGNLVRLSLRQKIVADVLIPNATGPFKVENGLSETRTEAKTYSIPSLLSF